MAKWKRLYSLPRRWQKNHLINKFGNCCYLCEQPFKSMKEITIDHWQPLSKGGLEDLENYRLAHLECNQTKADLTPEEFAKFQKCTF